MSLSSTSSSTGPVSTGSLSTSSPSGDPVLHHPIFGELRGEMAERARQHDLLLGREGQRTATYEEAQRLAAVMKEYADAVVREVGNVLKGTLVAAVIRAIVEAILTRSHVLIEGASGTGKTVAVKLVARVMGLPYERIDAMPD